MSLKKSSKPEAPHAIYADSAFSWVWRVMKTYQTPAKERGNQYARWFCYVTSPHTFGMADMGDAYVRDVISHAKLRAATTEWLEAYYPSDCVHLRAKLPTPTEWIDANGGQS